MNLELRHDRDASWTRAVLDAIWNRVANGLGFVGIVGFGLGFKSKSAHTVSVREGASVVRSTSGETRERREINSIYFGTGVRPARERPCRRRSPFSFSEVVSLSPFSTVLSTTALSEFWSTVERERLACSVVVFFREMKANLDPSSSAFMREVEAYSDPPSPTLASRKGSLLQLCLRRRVEACKAPRCRLETWCPLG
ncbi:hypothetical protein F2Q70_00044887 [Brassica cretica]|uniref:Uncharacterized protein n=1 Tax=Brassica cretica TaxID=69181 RepID=A0A8S9KGT7_BRACR|nr:hypothetical protein F2Q70_00044887 [Brassica cretica]